MVNLIVNIESYGKQVKVGSIHGENMEDARFCYDANYISDSKSIPISISMPFQKEDFTASQTRIFFEGLLPEGFSRKAVAKWLQSDEKDYLRILYGLGQECLGAIRITESSFEEENASYEEMTLEQVRELAHEGATKSAQLVTQAHLSLTGASGKVGLYFDDKNQRWYMPKGSAPSTHIVKQSHVRLDGMVTNEQLALLTASNLGIRIPKSFIINTGDKKDEEILFATSRYDRSFDKNTIKKIGGMNAPIRLHQEDFAQALGIPSFEKYENSKKGYLSEMFSILANFSSNPIEDQLRLWDMIVFDYLIGNTDNHLKNFSLLHENDIKKIRLAPAYDIVSTVIYDSSTRNMSIYIGNECNIDDISRESFIDASNEIGLSPKIAMEHFDNMKAKFGKALQAASDKLSGEGFTKAEEIKNKILKVGGIAKKNNDSN